MAALALVLSLEIVLQSLRLDLSAFFVTLWVLWQRMMPNRPQGFIFGVRVDDGCELAKLVMRLQAKKHQSICEMKPLF